MRGKEKDKASNEKLKEEEGKKTLAINTIIRMESPGLGNPVVQGSTL